MTLPYQPTLAYLLRKRRGELLNVFPDDELRTWRSKEWHSKPIALVEELERAQKTVSDPDRARLVVGALIVALLQYKDHKELWNLTRVGYLLKAVPGAISDWSGARRHDQKRAAYDLRDKELWRRADAMHKANDKLKATEIAERLAKPAVAKDFEKNGFLPPPSPDRIRKIIATVFDA